MSPSSALQDQTVVIVSACQEPGPELAARFAVAGARVVAMDADEAALERLAARHRQQIEPLVVEDCAITTLRLIRESWAAEPVHVAINLMPLAHPGDITAQIAGMTTLVRTFGRGLIAGRGTVITVVARPADPLALIGQGMCGALAASGRALAGAFAPHSVRFHTLIVPPDAPASASGAALFLSGRAAGPMTGTTMDLTGAA